MMPCGFMFKEFWLGRKVCFASYADLFSTKHFLLRTLRKSF